MNAHPPHSPSIAGHSGILLSSEAAAMLRCTDDTIVDYLQRGWIRGRRVGKRWLIDRDSIDQLLATGTSVIAMKPRPVGDDGAPAVDPS